MTTITVVGGGIGGLVAAITAAEAGATVTLHEAHRTLGGRWRSARVPPRRGSRTAGEAGSTGRASVGPYLVHEGPHVIYRDGALWAWLKERKLLGETSTVSLAAGLKFKFRYGGRVRTVPPRALVRALLVSRGKHVPVDESYADYVARRAGGDAAAVGSSAAGVVTYHPDPGSLSAAFVAERLSRVFSLPAGASYRLGTWGAMFESLGAHARSLGVTVELGSRIAEIGDGVTIIATELESARRLLGDETLDWPSGRCTLLDIGLRADRRDPFVLSDLDHCGWLEAFSMPDRSIAPAGEHLLQLHMPVRSKEKRADGVARLEEMLDAGVPAWRARTTYRLESLANGRTGALDHPGRTWRDRPPVDRGDGVYLVGDRVAAPGLLSEVSVNSALEAVRLIGAR